MKATLNRLKEPRGIALVAITAALYVALTAPFGILGFEMVQFRFSEILCLLAFIDPIYGVGITIGCFFANLASPFGLLDIAVGTFCTALSVICISKSKNLFLATIWPTIFSIPVAGVITLMSTAGVGFIATAAWLALCEFIMVTVIGYPVFRTILKNPEIYMLLKFNENKATLQ